MRCPRLTELPAPPPGRTGWPWSEESPPLPERVPGGRPWPRITIVTPSYNQGRFLEETIRSVLLQGYPDLEYVIVDGGSNDGSVGIVRRYERWLAHWSSEPDRGCAHALNKGFARATGEILGFLNSDDFYLPGCLRTVAAAMSERPAAGVVCGNGWFADESGRLGKAAHSDPWSLRRYAYRSCILFQPATFFRREAYLRTAGFNEANPVCWDGELWVDLALAGAEFLNIEDSLAAFRLHGGSITGSGRLKARNLAEKTRLFGRIMGRDETLADVAQGKLMRLRKFSGHPLRTLRDRLFFRSASRRGPLHDNSEAE